MRSPRAFPAISVSLALLWAASAARADPREAFRVERRAEAETCPDADALARLVTEVRGSALTASNQPAYRVVFERDATLFRALLSSESDGSVRVLSDAGATCTALARATAVTLALLIDADAAEDPRAAPAPAPKPKRTPLPAPAKLDTSPQPTPAPHSPRFLAAHVQAGLLAGVVRPIAPALSAGLSVSLARFRGGAGVLWALPGDLELGPGTVRTSLLGAIAEGCVAAATAPLRLDFCTGLLAGFVRAQARDYSRNDERSRTWIAVPVGLAAGIEPGAVGWQLGAAALVPIRRQDFAVDGVGRAYESTPVGALFWLRATGLVQLGLQ